jgi:hypothetical protein
MDFELTAFKKDLTTIMPKIILMVPFDLRGRILGCDLAPIPSRTRTDSFLSQSHSNLQLRTQGKDLF